MTHMDVSDQSTSKVSLNKHFTSCSLAMWYPGGSIQSWQGILDIWPAGGPRSTAFTLALHGSFTMTRKRSWKFPSFPSICFLPHEAKMGLQNSLLNLGWSGAGEWAVAVMAKGRLNFHVHLCCSKTTCKKSVEHQYDIPPYTRCFPGHKAVHC